jgi:hypothetical protein
MVEEGIAAVRSARRAKNCSMYRKKYRVVSLQIRIRAEEGNERIDRY